MALINKPFREDALEVLCSRVVFEASVDMACKPPNSLGLDQDLKALDVMFKDALKKVPCNFWSAEQTTPHAMAFVFKLFSEHLFRGKKLLKDESWPEDESAEQKLRRELGIDALEIEWGRGEACKGATTKETV